MEDTEKSLNKYSVVRLLKGENNRSIYEHKHVSLSDVQLLLFCIRDSAPICPRKANTDFDSGGSDPLFIIAKTIWCALERATHHQVYTECLFSLSL